MLKKLKYIYFLNSKSSLQSKNIFEQRKKDSIDIVAIAFNNIKTIEYQIKLLKKNLTDAHTYIVADNSTDLAIRQAIFELCTRHDVMYVSVPKNSYKRNHSHSSAIHWTYKNVLRKRNSQYFGFIDHDIFPLEPCSIIDRMVNGIYGRVTAAYAPDDSAAEVTIDQPYWSLWAGFFFMESKLLSGFNANQIDFKPKTMANGLRLDTGGGLWDSILKNIPYPGELAKYSYARFRETQDGNVHTDFYERLDEWLHIGNLSNWYTTPNLEEKNNYFDDLLNKALED